MAAQMKGAIYRSYGPPDVVQITDVAKPVPKDDQVLIKIRAASVNPLDWHFMRGEPYFLRLMTGLRRPKFPGLGADLAGEVESVGRNVRQFRPGDEVFGSCRGAFAEYACASEAGIALKPKNVTFEEAAAVSLAGRTALQGLRDKGRLRPGHEVLINGAAGGVGTFPVQIGKCLGAKVTGVCSTRNAELVRSLGADHVIDYTREDFTEGAHEYNLIFDCIGNHSQSAYKRVLNRNGIYIGVGASSGRWMLGAFARSLAMPIRSRFGSQKFAMMLAKESKEDLTTLGEMIASGKVKPAIDRRYAFSAVGEAIRYLEEGHARGKVIINLQNDSARRDDT